MDERSAPQGSKLDEHMIALGFDPERDRFEYIGAFTLPQAWRSLSETRRSVSVALVIRNRFDEEGDPIISVVLDKAQALHKYLDVEFNHAEQKNFEVPDWYFEGWVLAPRAARDQRVRIHVSTLYEEFNEDDMFTWQLFDAE
ncbi:hypothetical protein ASC61_01980 [Aeromicrobium sp. Root344]|uniref:hypothetical protein n=1 Tax=Aeromicrobium sp. Root344 TaxID=1736521 RepID=UPI0006F2799F|nr:hypothetical protein [Aeromicrobium sp. Root344]KQV73873.1 hypothetical protein ASC61_01980 [Aeromicrobium sp. Root344]